GRAKVEITSQRNVWRANTVFDTRPAPLPEDILLQHFVGWEIETEIDIFDPTTVTLMDFVSGAEDIHFFYVLPFSPRHALVETTHFSKAVAASEVYEQELRRYLVDRFGLSDWRIVHREKGVIPMPRQAPDLTARDYQQIIPLGLHSDTVKPSTGYCYPHAQHQASQQVQALFADAKLNAVPARSRLVRWLDAVFIGFLEEHPQRGGEIFFRLFNRVPSDALVRFLSDQARPSDVIRVMKALPMGAFIRQALRHVVRA
ncbi:MAG: lycopene cyclase family protein, partial [Pseudomonadota bacterium]|nr:lycopene cyclase family protein [Pseudomonadota bacterium]